MALDDVYQAGTDRVLLDLAQRPKAPKPQPPVFSLWGTIKAAGSGLVAGGVEAGASSADIAGAFGDILTAYTPSSEGGMFAIPTEQEQRESDQVRARLELDGINYRSDLGRDYRGLSRDILPDPVTAHGAEVAVSEFARIAGKAVGAGITLGPIGGAVASGLEEGFTAADKLAEQGVDLGTRSAVGAVTAAVQAATFALPVAGKTWAQTGALAIGGGTGGFVAQQAATRAILDGADYSKLADQYDPFDPVGLALSTLLPLGFGAVGMRAAAKARTAQEAAAAARAEADMIASPRPPGERTAVARATDEMVDAARVSLLRENVEAHRLTPAEDLQSAAAHQTAVAQAIDQMGSGQRVDVTVPEAQGVRATEAMAERLRPVVDEIEDELAALRGRPVTENPRFRQWFGDSKVVDAEGQPLVVYHGTGADVAGFDPEAIGSGMDAGKLGRGFYFTESSRWADGYAGAPEGGRAPNVMPVYLSITNPLRIQTPKGSNVWDALRSISREFGIDADPVIPNSGNRPNPDWSDRFAKEAQARGYDGVLLDYLKGQREIVAFRPEQIKSAIGNSGRFDPNSPSLTDQNAAPPAKAKGKSESQGDTKPPEGAAPKDGETVAGELPELDRAAAELERLNPDLPVRLDGMEEAIPLSELMARLRAEVADDLAEAPLVETAVLCALRAGM